VNSASVHVLGEDRKPISVTLDKRTLIKEAIARAGGLTGDGVMARA
jgi:protein involved in polysaccharide export with SLBB domain